MVPTTASTYTQPRSHARIQGPHFNYAPQYCKNCFRSLSSLTKSARRTFHGSAFYYGRQRFVFKLQSWQDNGTGRSRPAYNKHRLGIHRRDSVFIFLPHLYNNDKQKNLLLLVPECRRESLPGQISLRPVSLFPTSQGQFHQRRLPCVYRRVIFP